MQTNESTSQFRIAQTLSASLKSTTAMCQKAHLPPYQAFSAVSRRLRSSSSPVSHAIAMQTNEITNLFHCLQEIRSSSGPVSHTITMQTNEPTLSKHSLPVWKAPLPCAKKPHLPCVTGGDNAFCCFVALSHPACVCSGWNCIHSVHPQLSVTSWHSAMQLLSVQGETTNSVPSLLFLVVTAFPSSQGHLFTWFCKPLATKFTTASARWLPKLP